MGLRGHPGRAPGMAVRPHVRPQGWAEPTAEGGEAGGRERVGDKPKAAQLEVWAPCGPRPNVAVPPAAFMPHQGVGFAPAWARGTGQPHGGIRSF